MWHICLFLWRGLTLRNRPSTLMCALFINITTYCPVAALDPVTGIKLPWHVCILSVSSLLGYLCPVCSFPCFPWGFRGGLKTVLKRETAACVTDILLGCISPLPLTYPRQSLSLSILSQFLNTCSHNWEGDLECCIVTPFLFNPRCMALTSWLHFWLPCGLSWIFSSCSLFLISHSPHLK